MWDGPNRKIPTAARNEIKGKPVGGYSSICSKKKKVKTGY